MIAANACRTLVLFTSTTRTLYDDEHAPLVALTTSAYVALFIGSVLGATVQGSVGFGSNLVLAPVLWIFAPSTMPAAAVVAGTVSSALTLVIAQSSVHVRSVVLSAGAQVPGAILGGVALGVLSSNSLMLLAAAGIASGALLTARIRLVRPTAPVVVTAGLTSGFLTTTTAVGGPPLALAFQSRPISEIRGTMATLAAFNGAVAAATLLIDHRLHALHAVMLLATSLPACVLGVLLSSLSRPLVARKSRAVIIGICVLSCGALVGRIVAGT